MADLSAVNGRGGAPHGNTVSMTLGMLVHMPWYHYLLMLLATAALVVAADVRYGVPTSLVTRLRAAPRPPEHAAILLVVELIGLVIAAALVNAACSPT